MLKTFLLIVCLASTGCSTTDAPIANYKASRLTASYPEALSFDVDFELSNNNDEPLRLVKYMYTVTINGNTVYRGLAEAKQTIPRGLTIETTIPVVVPRTFVEGTDSFVWHIDGTLDYLAHGALAETLFDSRFWQPSTQIVASDSFEVPPLEVIILN